MIIPNTIYHKIILKYQTPILELQNESSDFIAGSLIGIRTMFPNLESNNIPLIFKFDSTIVTTQNINDLLEKYLIYTEVSPTAFNSITLVPYQMAWWIRSPHTGYDLIIFNSKEVINGFISICDFFTSDFRDYIAGPPFQIVNNNKEDLKILGYEIPPFNPVPRQPYNIVPFYTGIYENDIHAVDYI